MVKKTVTFIELFLELNKNLYPLYFFKKINFIKIKRKIDFIFKKSSKVNIKIIIFKAYNITKMFTPNRINTYLLVIQIVLKNKHFTF